MSDLSALKAFPKLKPITPMEMYLQQVNNMFQGIQATNNSQMFIPNQYGGLLGQNYIIKNKLVVMTTPFDTYPDTNIQGPKS